MPMITQTAFITFPCALGILLLCVSAIPCCRDIHNLDRSSVCQLFQRVSVLTFQRFTLGRIVWKRRLFQSPFSTLHSARQLSSNKSLAERAFHLILPSGSCLQYSANAARGCFARGATNAPIGRRERKVPIPARNQRSSPSVARHDLPSRSPIRWHAGTTTGRITNVSKRIPNAKAKPSC